MTSPTAAKAGLKQETIAIVAVGLTMLGTMLFTATRLEARMERMQTETRADREAFSREILRLTASHARLAGITEGPRSE